MEYEKLEEQRALVENQCDDVWTVEAMEIVDVAYRQHFMESPSNGQYGQWDHPSWTTAMDSYERDIKNQLRTHWENVSNTMTKNGRDALSVNAVDQAMDKLEWVLYRRKLGRKWCVPLMSQSHFADMVDYFEQNGDVFRLVSV